MIPAGISAGLPNVCKAIALQNDAAPTPIRIIGLGSSVEVAEVLPDPATQAPSAVVAAWLN